ncbi:sugar MFS transporter [Thalassotalea euphylliae]|uniref:Glucose/galactose MFS transporter n=1 Tax=Thalassotalea euphylliae TaxID=1655234 RepID=A0A3E0UCN2_9GAMM|nr:sugar MFS transporter [Thalassotalea euphylliae]REL34337.1 glucose/galactose MFS transporter [Thalassotalea euphylliae]
MPTKVSNALPIAIIGGLFFIFGFVTWLNGSLIPFLQIACELNHMEAYLVTMAFYIAYTVFALPMAAILKRTGYKNGMMLGLLLMAVGALIFIPAAEFRTYSIFLVALFVLASGLTILQTAANPYIVLLGDKDKAAMRISIMGFLNKGAGFLAPLVFTALVLSDMSQFSEAYLATLSPEAKAQALSELSSRLVTPYIIMAIVLSALAALIKFSPLPELEAESDNDDEAQDSWAILGHPKLIFGVFALFFYVGVEVVAGDTIGLFGKEMGVANFGQLTAYTMAFMMLGYVLGMICIPRVISQENALVASALLGLVLTTLLLSADTTSYSVWNSLLAWTGITALPNVVLYVAALGLANALVWPAIWPMALDGLGKLTSIGSALLIMSISGGAIMPMVYGALVESSGNSQSSYWIMLPCYLVILWYAVYGHKIARWSKSKAIAKHV